MSRYTGPVCKLCRREQTKLFLKGERCLTPHCAFERRPFPPGQHGSNVRRRATGFSVQLREKQKLRRIYGVTERVFRNYFSKASKQEGITGDNFLCILERRLDGRKVDIPSFLVKPGMVIELREKIANKELNQQSIASARVRKVPAWLELDDAKALGKVVALPTRADVPFEIKENVIVEFYNLMG